MLELKIKEENSCGCEPASDIKYESGTLSIDSIQIDFTESDKNIVDLAKRHGIGIPAPCHLNNRKNGCCNACVIEVNGEHKYACALAPKPGMKIVVNRKDLQELRKERIKIFKDAMKKGIYLPCDCSN